MVWIKLTLIIFPFFSSVYATDLLDNELSYFNSIDLNNDGFVSLEEISQTTRIIFQLVDSNNDKKISINELRELKQILELMK
jgi:Ca2+-binding EF-hand superfamily protein